jgi:hypothetical protein
VKVHQVGFNFNFKAYGGLQKVKSTPTLIVLLSSLETVLLSPELTPCIEKNRRPKAGRTSKTYRYEKVL